LIFGPLVITAFAFLYNFYFNKIRRNELMPSWLLVLFTPFGGSRVGLVGLATEKQMESHSAQASLAHLLFISQMQQRKWKAFAYLKLVKKLTSKEIVITIGNRFKCTSCVAW
jgi:hypothetical protein